MFQRILINTRKHIIRSGWIGLASVFVMTLAFLVGSIFGLLAIFANLKIQFIEQQSNMLVFFNVGMDQEIIQTLRDKWETDNRISQISYFSEEEAYQFYSNYTAQAVPEQFQVLSRFEDKKLPSSLEIKLKSLDDIIELEKNLQADIDMANAELVVIDINTETESTEGVIVPESFAEEDLPGTFEDTTEDVYYKYSDEPNETPINLVVDSENLNIQKDFFFIARVAGLITISILILFIVIFVFMTSEFRLYNQREEIGVMQLVGGSLFFIRSPYILEGGFFGLMGALLSSAIIGTALWAVFIARVSEPLYDYIIDDIVVLPLPVITTLGWIGIVTLLGAVGFLVGAISSYFSIKRYIR